MKRVFIVLMLSVLFACKDSDRIIQPPSSLIDWEGHGGVINERYRDSVIFLSTRNITNAGMPKMHIVHSNGQGLRALPADSFGFFYAVTWSPKKWKILFLADTYNTRSLYSMNCDGTNRLPIPIPARMMIPSLDWSPNGQKIAYIEIDASLGCRVGTMNPDGTSAIGISEWYPVVYRVSWSPTSSEIAFSPLDTTGGRIMIMNSDGSGLRALIVGLNAAHPSWSPDGRYIAFSRNFSRIFVHDMQTHQNAQVTSGPGDEWPSWSSDSRSIVFTRRSANDPNQRSALHSVRLDGSNESALTDTSAMDFFPQWQK